MSSSPKRKERGIEARCLERAAGFTLLELIVVIGMLVIVLGVSAPRIFRTLHRGRLRSEATNLLTTFRYSQGMAAVQRATYRVHFDLDKQEYYVTRDASRGDDFELTEEDLMASGDSSLFPGQRARFMPDDDTFGGTEKDEENSEWDDEENGRTNRNAAGRVDIFDEQTHKLADGVRIIKIVDGRGDEIEEGEFEVPVDPKGRAFDTSVYLGLEREGEPKYIVHIGANGLTEIIVEGNDQATDGL